MAVLSVLDSAGRRRSPATMPGYHAGRPTRNKGIQMMSASAGLQL
jgi:hypothetical protein